MIKLLDPDKQTEARKISLRIAITYLPLAILFQMVHTSGFSNIAFSIVGIAFIAYFMYFAVRRSMEQLFRKEASFWENEKIKLRSTLESLQDGYYETDMKGNLALFNHSLVDILGLSEDKLRGRNIADFMSTEDARKLKQTYQWISHTGTPVNCMEWEAHREDGVRKSVESSIVLIHESESVAPTGYRGIIRDITERKASERMLEESRYRYKSLFDHNPDLVCSFDLDGTFVTINPATEKLTGYSANQLMGRACSHLLAVGSMIGLVRYFVQARKGVSSSFELAIKHKRGSIVDLHIRLVPIVIDNQIVGVFAIGKDITEHKQAEETINHMAYHDALTDLPNRRLFTDQLITGMAQAERGNYKLAVLFLDLDRFKYINDSLGYSFGDNLLQTVSVRLRQCIGANGTVARMGGDEFTVLLPVVTDENDVVQTAESIIEAINKPILIEGRECSVTTSIGISLFPDDGGDAQTLMMNADAAMYRSKETNRNTYEFFNPAMSKQASERLAVEQELRKALERNELLLMYQPQLNFELGQITGVEALVRWQHPTRGMVPPGEFIPLAEETGMIVPIGEWVLRTACRQNQAWQNAGYRPMRVAVNLSAYQFKQSNIVQKVDEILKETGLKPEYLELEITESIAIQDADHVIETLYELKRLGIQISIDDFGTGYSSLSYLRDFPINRLKIDKSFVNDISAGDGDAVIAASIIAMARSLNLEVIAEGVETEKQFEFLRSKGCDEMQGYYFSKPLQAEIITDRLSINS